MTESGGTGSLAESVRRPLRSWLGEAVAVVGFYFVLVVTFVGPLVRRPFDHVTLSPFIGGRADQNLVTWILAWDWHALTTSPWSLFDANIHHPALRTLAGSEHMLGVVPLSGPAYALTGNPVFAYNFAFVSTLTLCGVFMYALLRHWGVARTGALFGGFVYSLYPGRIQASHELQLISFQYLPLILIFLDNTLRGGRLRSAVALGVFLLWQMLCSVYLAFISAISLAAYGVVFLWFNRREVTARRIGLVVGAVVAAAVVVVMIHLPYFELRSSGVITDYGGQGVLTFYSAHSWRSWLVSPLLLRVWPDDWSAPVPFSYVGLLPLLAAGFCLMRPRRDGVAWAAPAAFALLVVGYVFALGPTGNVFGHSVTLPYGSFVEWVPGFSSMRVPFRFRVAVMLGVSALAGIGFARALLPLEARSNGRWWAAGLLALVLAGTTLEYDLFFDRPAARPMATGGRVPPVYLRLAELPEGAVLEIPANDGAWWEDATLASEYMYYSTFHWNRLINGYSGYRPPSAALSRQLSRALPDAHATRLLVRASGLRYVVVHLAKLRRPMRAKWLAQPAGLELVAHFGPDLLFEVAEPDEPDLIDVMRTGPAPGRTLLGNEIAILPVGEQRAETRFTAFPPSRARPGRVALIEIEVRNPTRSTWPALSHDSPDRVFVDSHFERLDSIGVRTARNRSEQGSVPIPYDLGPGGSVRIEMWIHPPHEPGHYELEVGLRQADGDWFEGSLLRHEIVVE